MENKNTDILPKGIYTAEICELRLTAYGEDREPIVCLAFGTEERKGIITLVFELITTAINICEVNKLLRSIVEPLPVEFKTYKQYSDLIADIFEVCDDTKFKISYDPSKFGFRAIKILEVL